MRESMFPVRSSILSPGALVERVLPGYALPEPRSCRLISRSMNDIYEVTAGAETYFLRVSGQGWRTRDAVAAELALIADFYARGVAVAPAIPRDDGTLLASLAAPEGERFAVLFAEAPGAPVRNITSRQARDYGRLAAALHTAADASPTTYCRFDLDECHLLDEPLQAVRAAMVNVDAGDDLSFLESVAERVRHRLRALPRTSSATVSVTGISTRAMSASMPPARRRSSTSIAWGTAGAPMISPSSFGTPSVSAARSGGVSRGGARSCVATERCVPYRRISTRRFPSSWLHASSGWQGWTLPTAAAGLHNGSPQTGCVTWSVPCEPGSPNIQSLLAGPWLIFARRFAGHTDQLAGARSR